MKIWIKVLRFKKKDSQHNWTSGILDLYFLRRIIKIKNPKMVLELGSGIGISSEAILDQISQDSKLVTIENNKTCLNLCESRLKKYKKNYEIIESEVIISKDKINIETMIYQTSKTLDFSKFDLIYIDGPSWTFDKDNKFISGIPRGDIFYFFDKIKKGTIIVLDGSKITRKQIHRFCKSIEFLGVYKSFSFKKSSDEGLNDSTYNKLKKWEYLN
ncbi:hypothetical protein OAM14_00450 [Candidatus Pelagibacter sp.]|nr:hypothetical protein [Candidatus Pelagibacter sp.]